MARRSKKKKEMDIIEASLMIPLLVTFYFVFEQTKSFKSAAIASGMVLVVVIAI